MSKCRRNISYDITQCCEQKYREKTKIRNKPKLSKQSPTIFNLSQIVVVLGIICLLLAIFENISVVNAKLTRKTYTVWDLSPKEFDNLLLQEKSLQKRKRNLDYFLRRRAKKTKELLPLEEYEKEGLFSDTQNNLGKLC